MTLIKVESVTQYITLIIVFLKSKNQRFSIDDYDYKFPGKLNIELDIIDKTNNQHLVKINVTGDLFIKEPDDDYDRFLQNTSMDVRTRYYDDALIDYEFLPRGIIYTDLFISPIYVDYECVMDYKLIDGNRHMYIFNKNLDYMLNMYNIRSRICMWVNNKSHNDYLYSYFFNLNKAEEDI
jgi:hypothetical protein